MVRPHLKSHGAEAPGGSPEHGASLREREAEAQKLNVGVDASGILKSVDGIEEGSESADGRVSERAKEGIGEQKGSTAGKFQQFQQKRTEQDAAALKARLIETPPPPKVMVRQIQKHIHKELVHLMKEGRRYERKGAYRELNEIVSRMRELHTILAQLLHATAEWIKGVWLKVVHGIV